MAGHFARLVTNCKPLGAFAAKSSGATLTFGYGRGLMVDGCERSLAQPKYATPRGLSRLGNRRLSDNREF